ncbi:alpha/beta fold hydrolase [Ahrensia sp. R2A130]|uniref:alpha/beta fold hydrolase n=1 Tax=Ahrensia sp. R2A130 TaxID=744979 RepID=UPI0001E0C378|nr:alpha/beta hydrolase [Ahrensia sp. R2A130]EFL88794.1 lysophospholipase L2 [Ahrensia sp. R2A130]
MSMKPQHASDLFSLTGDDDAQLYSIIDNPAPDGATIGWLETSDGVKLRYARWETLVRPSKGTIVILHGRSETIEKYFETITDFRSRGFGVLAYDMRGQGASSRMTGDRKKGHVDSFAHHAADLEQLMEEVALPDCKPPYFAIGHSSGALVALLAAPRLGNRLQRMVLLAPLLGLTKIPISQTLLRRVTGLLNFLGLGRAYIGGSGTRVPNKTFIGNKLTSDTARFERNRAILDRYPDLAIHGPTIGWVHAACLAMQRVTATGYTNRITIPTLFIAAGNDEVVDSRLIERLGDGMRSGAFITVSGAKHEVLQERDVFREQMLAAFDAFIPGTQPGSSVSLEKTKG